MLHLVAFDKNLAVRKDGLCPQPQNEHPVHSSPGWQEVRDAVDYKGKGLFCWHSDGSEEKYAKDTAYWRMWGKDRNRVADLTHKEEGWNYWNDWDGWTLPEPKTATNWQALVVEFEHDFQSYHEFQHGQESGTFSRADGFSIFKEMDWRYIHNWLPCCFFTDRIPVESIKPLGVLSGEMVKNKIEIDINWNKRRLPIEWE